MANRTQDLVDQLCEDLEGLTTILTSKNPLLPSFARITASSILRKWLIENNLSTLGHALNVQFSIPSHETNDIVCSTATQEEIRFFMTAGIMLNGIPMKAFYVSDDPPLKTGPTIPIENIDIKDYRPAKYLKSKRVYFNKNWFSVEKILSFAANKYGGVHFDTSRQKNWQTELELAANYFVVGNPSGLPKQQLIEPYSEKHEILLVLPKEKGHLWNCIDIELLAAAQSFTNLLADGEKLVTFR